VGLVAGNREKPDSRIILVQNITIPKRDGYRMNDSSVQFEFETANFAENGLDYLFIYLDNKLMSKFTNLNLLGRFKNIIFKIIL
jgi:hypothetical protein